VRFSEILNRLTSSRIAGLGLALSAATLPLACDAKTNKNEQQSKSSISQKLEPAAPEVKRVSDPISPGLLVGFKPGLPEHFGSVDKPIDERRVALGRQLYFETRLSKNHDVSCNSCHNLQTYGVDNQPVSPGHKQQLGGRNSPTVYNAAGHFVQFWDGRSPHVEHQATQPVLNPLEMAMKDEAAAAKTLASIPEYVAAFKAAFPHEKEPISLKNAGIAMGAFERGLVTPSRWDEYLSGKSDALSPEEKRGFNLFVQTGCAACHGGPLVGGHMYQKVGVVQPWPSQKDQGRFEVTKSEGDRMMFKVPSLLNVEKTAPYFHDGTVPELKEAVKLMATHQLGRTLTDEDAQSIVTWLEALTGKLPESYIVKPSLPASSANTPAADPS
jgi:cytochrome c peroxidase